MSNRIHYTLQLADNALIIGHRLSEWCGHGPILEQDIALTNMALDHIGQARSFFQHAANLFNELPQGEKETIFSSVAISDKVKKGEQLDEDDLAYLRDSWDFRNALLTEVPNKDWAYTVVRSFFYDTFNFLYYTELIKSKDVQLASIAEKSLKEVTYHQRWSAEWMIRLGDGTDVSKQKVQEALNDYWMYSGELFKMSAAEQAMAQEGIAVNTTDIAKSWTERVDSVLAEAKLTKPEESWMQEGGKQGRHSEYLGYILSDLQFMQRAYPGMEW